jgi:Chaperone of endosialidase
MRSLFISCLMLLCLAAAAQTGNVGIGTATPQRKLHVIRGAATASTYHADATLILESDSHNYLQFSNFSGLTSGIFSGTSLTAQRSGIKFAPDSSILFSSGGSINRMALDNKGYLGVGVTVPESKFHVRTFASGGTFHVNATAILESNTTNILQLSNSATAIGGILSGTNLTQQRSAIFFNADSSIRFNAGGTLNFMSLDNTGYLGINNSNPATRLHVSNGVSGNITTASSRITTFEDNASSYIQLLNPNANESGILAGNASTLIKSGIVFTADSSINLRSGGNTTRIRIDNEGSIVFDGPTTLPTSGITPPVTTNGNRVIWWADRAAFRVGGLFNPVWTESSLGKWSFSSGYNTHAIGDYAATFGNSTDATGDAAFATGNNTSAPAINSFAGGNGSVAGGANSLAFGRIAKTGGSSSIAVGNETLASGEYAAAFGYRDTASGYCSGGFGLANNAKGDLSFTIGHGLVAKPFGTIAVGSYNYLYTHSSTFPSPFAPIFVVGVGTDENSRDNGFEVYRGGNVRVGSLDVNSFVNSNLTPFIDDTYQLGNSTRRWKEVWSANPFLQSSDMRLKSNIQPLQYGLQTVLAMKPVSYNMKTNLQNKELGFLAQDMEKIVSEVVVSPEDDGMKAMKYTSLIPVLVQAIKDQQEIIERLEKRLAQLEKGK